MAIIKCETDYEDQWTHSYGYSYIVISIYLLFPGNGWKKEKFDVIKLLTDSQPCIKDSDVLHWINLP